MSRPTHYNRRIRFLEMVAEGFITKDQIERHILEGLLDSSILKKFMINIVDNGLLDCREALIICLKYMSEDDVEKCLDMNEISERFLEENI